MIRTSSAGLARMIQSTAPRALNIRGYATPTTVKPTRRAAAWNPIDLNRIFGKGAANDQPFVPIEVQPIVQPQPAHVPAPSAAASAIVNTVNVPAPFRRSIPVYSTNKDAAFATFSQWTSERAVFVKDVGVIERQYARFGKEMPDCRPFYAIKCSNDPVLLETLVSLGAGFDCATGFELKLVHDLGVASEDIIFANPIKNAEDLLYAQSIGVRKMTFDNADELIKIKKHFPTAQVILRILADDSGSKMRFGSKFGAAYPSVPPLLQLAKDLELDCIGVSFHIGSGCFDSSAYDKAISLSRRIFDLADEMGMPAMTFLDVGGGLPGHPVPHARGADGTPSFEEFGAVVTKSIAQYFGDKPHVQKIAEPGRYFATGWTSLFTLVQGKREQYRATPEEARKFLYYINDGVYGSFNCIMFDHAVCSPIPAHRYFGSKYDVSVAPDQMCKTPSLHPSTFFGPTCDSMDVVTKDFPVEELHVGQWVAFEHMGAYTHAAATRFNGVHLAETQYVKSLYDEAIFSKPAEEEEEGTVVSFVKQEVFVPVRSKKKVATQ